jgi:hypothetical protein
MNTKQTIEKLQQYIADITKPGSMYRCKFGLVYMVIRVDGATMQIPTLLNMDSGITKSIEDIKDMTYIGHASDIVRTTMPNVIPMRKQDAENEIKRLSEIVDKPGNLYKCGEDILILTKENKLVNIHTGDVYPIDKLDRCCYIGRAMERVAI